MAGNAKPADMPAPAPLAVHAATPPIAAAAPAVPTPLAGIVPSPEGPPVVQWTPPGTAAAQQATPPVAASPGSFWEVLNAEILSPAEAEPSAVPAPAVQTPSSTPHEPAVQGLPLPPVQQAQQGAAAPARHAMAHPPMAHAVPLSGQHAQHPHQAQHAVQPPPQLQQPQALASTAAGGMLGMPGGGGMVSGAPLLAATAASAASPHSGMGETHGRYVMVHSCRVVVDQRVTRSATLLLGMGQVSGRGRAACHPVRPCPVAGGLSGGCPARSDACPSSGTHLAWLPGRKLSSRQWRASVAPLWMPCHSATDSLLPALACPRAQVWAMQSEAAALSGVSWPQELHVVKTLAQHTAKHALASKPGCRKTRLRMSYASTEAEVGGAGPWCPLHARALPAVWGSSPAWQPCREPLLGCWLQSALLCPGVP